MSVRAAAVAGRFYPADAGELTAQLQTLLAAVPEEVRTKLDAPELFPKAIIAPHAGYAYSGPVAASAYTALRHARAGSIERVVLLGPCHRVPLNGFALADATAFDTPLGTIQIDSSAEDLLRFDFVSVSNAAHELEHCLEVQLPFLTQVLATPFTIVPLVVGEASTEQACDVLRSVWGGTETLIVVSSDLSHFHSYEDAHSLDSEASRAIEELAPERIRPEQACGRTVIQGLLAEARTRGMSASILDVRNSGDTAGGRQEVVGYGAYMICESA
jgi:hypothetical protein